MIVLLVLLIVVMALMFLGDMIVTAVWHRDWPGVFFYVSLATLVLWTLMNKPPW